MMVGNWKLYLAVLAVITLIGVSYWEGKKNGKVEQLKDSVQAYERREKINAKVQDATRYELCVSLGGMPDDCDELRRMDETAEGQ